MSHQTAETQLVYIPDWEAQGVNRLLVPWDAPRIRAFTEALSAGAQTLEDQIADLAFSTHLEAAGGDALDQWGDLVGEQRLGLSDNDYRQFIQARMLVNRSNGTIDDLLEIADVATEPNVDVFHIDNQPAGGYIVVIRTGWMTDAVARRVARLLEDARPVGKHLTAVETIAGGMGFEDADWDPGPLDLGPIARLIH